MVPPDSGRPDAGVLPIDDGGTPLDGGLLASEACHVLNDSRCHYLVRCGLLEQSPAALEACAKTFEATWCGPMTWPSHVAAGALRYDAQKAEACGEAFATKSCAEWETLPVVCGAFLRPRVQLGQPCFDGFVECADGVCRGTACPRTCQPRALLNDTCSADGDCSSRLYCRASPFLPAVGQCAEYGAAGASCDANAQCLEGLRCMGQQCRALPTAGLSCLERSCAAQSYCDAYTGDAGVCVLRKPETATCTGDQCQAALLCEPRSQTCLRRVLSSGEPCTLLQQCPTGETCVGATAMTTGACHPPLGTGEACVSANDCEHHLACLAADGGKTCQPRADAGTACDSALDCRASAICQQGTCAELPLAGESCVEIRVCRWGLCRDRANADGGSVCGALLSAGQQCARADQCASGACDKGTCLPRCLP